MPGGVTRVLDLLVSLHLTTELEKNFWLSIWVDIFNTSRNFGYVSQDVLKSDTFREVPGAGKSKVKDHCPKRRSGPYLLPSCWTVDLEWWEEMLDPLLLHVILHPHPSNIVARIIAAVRVIRLIFMSYPIIYMSYSSPFTSP